MKKEAIWKNRIVEHGTAPAHQFLAHELNARRHPGHQRDALRGSLNEVGWVAPVIVSAKTGKILDGHARIEEALSKNEHGLVPFVKVDVSENEERTILATFDPITGLATYEREALDALLREVDIGDAALQTMLSELAAKEGLYLDEAGATGAPSDTEPQIDRAAELNKKWKVKTGDLWLIGNHRLLCGDSTKAEDVTRVMGGEKAEMVWTDPPYGVSVGDKNKWLNSIAPSNRVEGNLENDSLDEFGLSEMLVDSFANIAANCTNGASWYVAAPAGPLHLVFGKVLKDMGIWRQTIQWVKNNATFSPMGVSYHWKSEPIFYGWLPNGAHRYHGDRKQTTVWEFDRPAASPDHPTMKPVALVAQAVEHASLAGQIVAEPFAGSGTTLVAAQNLKRKCYAIEISPDYCAVILERMAQAFSNLEIKRDA